MDTQNVCIGTILCSMHNTLVFYFMYKTEIRAGLFCVVFLMTIRWSVFVLKIWILFLPNYIVVSAVDKTTRRKFSNGLSS